MRSDIAERSYYKHGKIYHKYILIHSISSYNKIIFLALQHFNCIKKKYNKNLSLKNLLKPRKRRKHTNIIITDILHYIYIVMTQIYQGHLKIIQDIWHPVLHQNSRTEEVAMELSSDNSVHPNKDFLSVVHFILLVNRRWTSWTKLSSLAVN